jgi:chemotaxis protein MotB
MSALEAELADALRARLAAEAAREAALSEAEQRAALLAQANEELETAEAASAESERQVALLNEQVAALRSQLASLQSLLDEAAARDAEAQVQIEALGSQLNTALAQLAAEERARAEAEAARAELEAAEAARLAEEARNLERYRSEFFGRLRELLEGREGVRIDGDRFVFSSEVLFDVGSAELSPEGLDQIENVAELLTDVADDIPDSIDWIIRVDGHTDDQQIAPGGEFDSNWELSQARALSVVLYMTEELGIPPNRLAAAGFGEYRPIATNETPQGRAQNRRIELKLTER